MNQPTDEKYPLSGHYTSGYFLYKGLYESLASPKANVKRWLLFYFTLIVI